MRLLLAAICLPALLAAQDAREIVRRAVELDRKNVQLEADYAYRERDEQRELDGQGKARRTRISAWDVTPAEGTPYRRLVARDDKPLSAKEQQAEEDKLHKSIEDRLKETPEQRRRRVSDWDAKRQKQRESLRELPDAFDFTLVGEESLNGGRAWVIDAAPKPGYKPKSQAASYLPHIKARLWIDKTDYQGIRFSLQSLSTISFGGFLLRLAPGSVLNFERVRINGEVWLPKSAEVKLAAKLALIKTVRVELSVAFSDYKKFQTDSRIVNVSEPKQP